MVHLRGTRGDSPSSLRKPANSSSRGVSYRGNKLLLAVTLTGKHVQSFGAHELSQSNATPGLKARSSLRRRRQAFVSREKSGTQELWIDDTHQLKGGNKQRVTVDAFFGPP